MEKRKVLLIDDDHAVLMFLTAKLAKEFDVVSTLDPRQAAELARTHLPDVILCDIDMPELTGGDVWVILQRDSITARIPFMYLTSLVTPEETKELEGQVGGRPGVSKRATVAELVQRIDELTQRPTTPR